MNFVALKMLTGDRAKYLGLIFTIAFCTFLLENQTSIFAVILKRTGSQIADVTDAEIWMMDPKTEYFEQTKALKDTDLTRVRGVEGVHWAVTLFKGNPIARTNDGKFASTICLGLDDATLTGAPRKMLLGSWQRLREPDSVIIDKAGYVLLYPGEPLELGRTLELNDHKVTIVGISDGAPGTNMCYGDRRDWSRGGDSVCPDYAGPPRAPQVFEKMYEVNTPLGGPTPVLALPQDLAVCIVREEEKPSFREASCWSVAVRKGG